MKTSIKAVLAIVIAVALIAAWFWGRASVQAPGGGNVPGDDAESANNFETTVITKVIDGDTVVVAGGDHVRLLGIDSDEKGYPCYDAARLRLEELVLGKAVSLENDNQDADQYGRKLRYIFLDGKNINQELVSEGLAVARFYPENQKYKSEITAAEAAAMEEKTGCKWSGKSQTADPGGDNLPAVEHDWKILAGDAVDVCATKDYVGKDVVAEGLVAQAYRSDSDTVFLDFGAKYPNSCFTAVIFKSSLTNFPEKPEDIYSGKTVRVKGAVTEYQGKSEMILKSPSQIEIVTDK